MAEYIQFIPVEDLIPEFTVSACDLSQTQDWGSLLYNIPEAHKYTKGEGIKIAILDTGKPDHIDLNDNIVASGDGTCSISNLDMQGHGTHCAGIVAAIDNDQGVIGVAPSAKLVTIKVLEDSGRGSYDTIIRGLMLAMENNVDIINMSLGSTEKPPPFLHEVIKQAYDKGIILVAAAGNTSGTMCYPALFDEVIAVAAVDKNGKMARFSSRGAKIDIGAPGVAVYSCYLNNQYAVLNGTSQASPFIAGICALILSWSRNTESAPEITNGRDMLKILDELCGDEGAETFPVKHSDLGYGIPDFANFKPWKETTTSFEERPEEIPEEIPEEKTGPKVHFMTCK